MDGQFFTDTKIFHEDEGIYLLKCLCMCLIDEEGKTLINRHKVLMNRYLDLRANGIKCVDLPYLMSPLEFFSEQSVDECLYYCITSQCLKLLHKPILLFKSSDACFAVENLKNFFSALGNCFYVVADNKLETTILDVILYLITYQEQKPNEVSLEIRLEAVGDSFLPEIIVSMMYFITDKLYLPLIEIMYQLSLQPSLANLFQSMGCLDFWIRKVAIKNTLSMREASIKEITSHLLWSVLRSSDTFGDALTMNSQSLSILRGWLRREVLFGQTYERNNIAALLLQTIITIPKLEVSKSGFLEDVGMLAVASEFGTQNTWANKIHFRATRDDLDFKKTLITILLIRNNDSSTKMVLLENRFLNAIANILNFKKFKGAIQWNQSQHLELINCYLYALPIFSKHFREDYTRSGATKRILELIEYFSQKQQNLRLVKNCCLCIHLLISHGISLKHFRVLHVPRVLLNLIIYCLQCLKLNLLVQTILHYCFCAITNLIQDHKRSKEIFATEIKNIYCLISIKLQRPSASDTKVSNSLLISATDFIWQCVILNEHSIDLYFENLGIHNLLYIMEDAPFAVQLQYLSVLCDLCCDPRCVPQIVTWIGKDRSNNFYKVICDIWRKQEKVKGVIRDEYGCIKDVEIALMGEMQRVAGEAEDTDISTSPALVEMIGCARPIIASIVHLVQRRHYNKVRLATSVYLVPFDNGLSPEDKITLQIILNYEELKSYETLLEVRKAVDKAGVILLPLNIEVIHKLIMTLINLASVVQRSQRSILKTKRMQEVEEENKIYKKIDEYKLTTAVKETVARDAYLMASNKVYRKWKHEKYEQFLDDIEELYADKKELNFHQTFYHPRNFIVVNTGRDAHIISIKKRKELTSFSQGVLNSPESCAQLPKEEQ